MENGVFEKVLVEEELRHHPRLDGLLSLVQQDRDSVQWIDRSDDIFNRVKKPYLQKRQGLQLFVAKKRGTLVKEAPAAYGQSGEPHYYFIHAYNCVYECSYCYLQGHFHSPDLVIFLNHDDILRDIEHIAARRPNATTWFHAGEFSDSLALSHLTQELPLYYEHFARMPQAKLEIRTKSANIKSLSTCAPLPNVIISFSLAPENNCRQFDLKAPPLKARLSALQTLHRAGHPIGLHFDPIISGPTIVEDYRQLLQQLQGVMDLSRLEYLSLGVVRFTKSVFKEVQQNYPDAAFLTQDLVRAADGKVRYPRPLRLYLMKAIRQLAIEAGIAAEKIYLCMENDAITQPQD